jgi:hypothetical protein
MARHTLLHPAAVGLLKILILILILAVMLCLHEGAKEPLWLISSALPCSVLYELSAHASNFDSRTARRKVRCVSGLLPLNDRCCTQLPSSARNQEFGLLTAARVKILLRPSYLR